MVTNWWPSSRKGCAAGSLSRGPCCTVPNCCFWTSPRPLRLAHGSRRVRLEMTCDGTRAIREFPLDGLADNTEFLSILRAGDIETMHTLETTLEDVFVQMTG